MHISRRFNWNVVINYPSIIIIAFVAFKGINACSQDTLKQRIEAAIQIMKGTNRFDSFLAIKPDSTIWNVDKSELKEVYFFPEKKGMPAGSLNLSYSEKLNHFKESFNSTVDSVKKMKLFKTETIFDEFYSEKDKKVWPSTKNITEMREYTVDNFEEIMTYFNRYKTSIGKKRLKGFLHFLDEDQS